jgi:glyoxylase-like metal-dependent hydrolase (beta-lactamase superfamily II)
VTLPSIRPINLGNAFDVEPIGQGVNAFLVGPPLGLINAGHPCQVDALKAAIRQNGADASAIERIVCTSWAIDSVGGTRHFPRADVFLLSPDGRAPKTYRDWVDTQKAALEPYLKHTGADIRAFFNTWFGAAPSNLEFIPLSVGNSLTIGGISLEVLPLHGFDEGACILHARAQSALFCSELSLNGLPPDVRNAQAFLGDLDRAAATGATSVYPTHGRPSTRGEMDLRRAARWANNLLSNAQHAMRGGVTLAGFVERDLGYPPENPVEYALRMHAIHPFLEELVTSHVIEAAGEGFHRVYATNIEPRV